MWFEKLQVEITEAQKKQTEDKFGRTDSEHYSLEFIFCYPFIPQAKGAGKRIFFYSDTRSKQEFKTLKSIKKIQ